MRHCSISTSAALAALLAVACGPPKQPEEVALWTIDPVISLGVATGDSVQTFGRVTNALKLSDGRIAVADAGNFEVRAFNPNGTHALTIGRRGSGAGELPALVRLARLPGDTILAGSMARINKYAPNGNVIRQFQTNWSGLARPPYTVEAAHPLQHGHYLLQLVPSNGGQRAQAGMQRPDNIWVVWRKDEKPDTLGVFPGLEQLSVAQGNERLTALFPYPADTRFAINEDWIVIADLASDSVLRYDIRKGRGKWIHLPVTRQPVTDSTLAEVEAAVCARATSDAEREQCRAEIERAPRQSHYPELADVAVDSTGDIWVRTNPPLVRGFADWRVYDEDGIGMARIAIPASVRITQIGQRYLIGMMTDARGVQRVVEYKLERHILEKWKGMRIVPREEYR